MNVPILLLALAAPPNPIAGADLLPAAMRWNAVAGCVRVTDGNDRGPVASAACIGYKDGYAYLLTADHVVAKSEARVFEFYSEKSYPKAERIVAGMDELVRLPDADVALLRVKLDMNPTVLPLGRPGERPRRFPFAAVSVGCPSGETPVTRSEQVVAKRPARRENGEIAFFWELAQRPVGGMSGGPLLDAKGHVVGICSAAQLLGPGYFAHLDEILAGLKTKNYSWLIPPDDR